MELAKQLHFECMFHNSLHCKFLFFSILILDYRLTGDEIMSDGKAILLGVEMAQNRRQFLSQIGYCPQFDSIIGVMTGREMLRLFARLRGKYTYFL